MEIDESKFVKRKYGKGKRKVCKDWVLGGICRETGECFMRIVKNRSKVTLLSIIKEYVLPKTTIITDCYVSYHDLQNLEGMKYMHYTVNHSDTFKVGTLQKARANTWFAQTISGWVSLQIYLVQAR